jgi:apolipoprotein N-acyltransferase
VEGSGKKYDGGPSNSHKLLTSCIFNGSHVKKNPKELAGVGSLGSLKAVTERWYRWGACALSGILLVLGFAPFSCATCGWVALVPAWWAITRSERVRRQPIRHGYLIGLIYFGGTFWWISDVTPVGTVLLILYLALYPGLWFLLVARLLLRGPSRPPILWQAAAGAALWVVLEWWRSWFLTGFDWNELGATEAPSIVFRQLAAYGGVPLISFVLAAVNILWAEGLLAMVETFRQKRVVRVSLPFGAALLAIAVCFALGAHHLFRHAGETKRGGLNFACIQPNIPQIPFTGGKWSDFQQSEDAALAQEVSFSMQAIKAKPDLLIWPEAIIDEGIFQDRPLNEAVHSICEVFNGYFMLGSQDFDTDGHKLYNCAYLFTPGGDQYEYYRKTRLVILGEYLPFGDTFPWFRKLAGMGMDFTPGPGPKKFVMTKVSFAPLICIEDTLAEVPDKAARLKPDFFVTITNDGWYTGWFAKWGVRQHLNLAVFRCVEHDRPMIRCANNGISCEIDQNGTVTDRLRNGAGGYIDVAGIFARRLDFYPAQATFYERAGDWIVLLSALVSVILGVQFFRRRP